MSLRIAGAFVRVAVFFAGRRAREKCPVPWWLGPGPSGDEYACAHPCIAVPRQPFLLDRLPFAAVPAHATLALTAQTEHGYYGTWAIAQSPSLLVSVGGGYDPSDNVPVGDVYTRSTGRRGPRGRREPPASSMASRGRAHSSPRFGASGTVVTSPEGLNWTVRSSGTGEHLNGLLWSGAEFIAVGGAGTILASVDGVSWAGRASGTSTALNAIARSPGRFVAVGEGGAIVSSADGLAWAAVASNTTRTLNGIAWSGSRSSSWVRRRRSLVARRHDVDDGVRRGRRLAFALHGSPGRERSLSWSATWSWFQATEAPGPGTRRPRARSPPASSDRFEVLRAGREIHSSPDGAHGPCRTRHGSGRWCGAWPGPAPRTTRSATMATRPSRRTGSRGADRWGPRAGAPSRGRRWPAGSSPWARPWPRRDGNEFR